MRSLRVLVCMAVYVMACSACGGSSPTAPTPQPPPVVVVPPVAGPPAPAPPIDPRFDLTFFRQFAHGSLQSQPGAPLIPTKRWTRAPRVYLRTVDDTGQPIHTAMLEQTAGAIINGTSAWAGGQFGLAELQRGTETRAGQPEWLTVTWASSLPSSCGHTNLIGAEGTIITLSRNPDCHCGTFIVQHELGHAMGYYHTDNTSDVMHGTTFSCNRSISAREAYHATLVYSLPAGTVF